MKSLEDVQEQLRGMILITPSIHPIMLTLDKAATITGIPMRSLSRYCAVGTLKAKKLKGKFITDTDSLYEFYLSLPDATKNRKGPTKDKGVIGRKSIKL